MARESIEHKNVKETGAPDVMSLAGKDLMSFFCF